MNWKSSRVNWKSSVAAAVVKETVGCEKEEAAAVTRFGGDLIPST